MASKQKVSSLVDSMAHVEPTSNGAARLFSRSDVRDDLALYMALCLIRAVIPSTGRAMQWNLPQWTDIRLKKFFGIDRTPGTVRTAMRGDSALSPLWDALQGKTSLGDIQADSEAGRYVEKARAEAKRWSCG